MKTRLLLLALALLVSVPGPILAQTAASDPDGGTVAAGGNGTPSTTSASTVSTTSGSTVSAGGEGAVPTDQNLNKAMVNLNLPTSDLNQPTKDLNTPMAGGSADAAGATTPASGAATDTTTTTSATTAATGTAEQSTSTGQSMQIYSTAYSPAEAGTDKYTAAGLNAQGTQLAPGQVAVDPSVIPYGTQFTVNNSALNQAAISEGAPTDGSGNAIFTATDTGGAVVNGTAANANGYSGTPVVDFYAPTSSSYSSMQGATSSAVTINIVKAAGSTGT